MPPLTPLFSGGISIPGMAFGTNAQGIPDFYDSGVISTTNLGGDTIFYVPWFAVYRGIVSGFKIRVTNIGTATKIRAGIYAANRASILGTAAPNALLASTGDVVPAVDDNLVLSLASPLAVSNQWYWIAIIADALIVMDFVNKANTKEGVSIVGRDASRVVCVAGSDNIGPGWTQLPNPSTGSITPVQSIQPLLRVIYTS